MDIKNAVKRSVVVITILLLSILIGYAYQLIGHKVDLKKHPREYSEYVEKYSSEYGVPEYIVYSVLKNASNFTSNYVSPDGRVGLMQISEDDFDWLKALTKEDHAFGILYDPETNIKYGTYMLSSLYTEHSRWKTVYAICVAGKDEVENWCSNPANTDDNGNLKYIPDDAVRAKVEALEDDAELYRTLYYQ